MATSVNHCGDIHASKAINTELWPYESGRADSASSILAVLLYGSWNVRVAASINLEDGAVPRWVGLVEDALGAEGSLIPQNAYIISASVKVDSDDDSVDICAKKGAGGGGLNAPPDLPAMLFLGSTGAASDSEEGDLEGLRFKYAQLSGASLEVLLNRYSIGELPSRSQDTLVADMGLAMSSLFEGSPQPTKGKSNSNKCNKKRYEPEIRLFVAGDRSQVGKSSICLGLLGTLLNSGKYAPADLAYIKPATQCEQTQLVEEFCKHKGIEACVPIGPIVYYKGFTRAFLKGETGETSAQLLQKASYAVDELARDKKVVIIDGVGYPAVGSITGTDNASVAKACGKFNGAKRSPVPVLLVGKSGVGDAVDSFSINSTYFTHRNVPVIGAIFNMLSLEGFYSLSNCKEAIEMYFRKFEPDRTAFGFIPEIPLLKDARDNVANASNEEHLKHDLETAELFVAEFSKRVNVDRILKSAREASLKYMVGQMPTSGSKRALSEIETSSNAPKNVKLPRPLIASENKEDNHNHMNRDGFLLTREQIEAMASAAGAAGG